MMYFTSLCSSLSSHLSSSSLEIPHLHATFARDVLPPPAPPAATCHILRRRPPTRLHGGLLHRFPFTMTPHARDALPSLLSTRCLPTAANSSMNAGLPASSLASNQAKLGGIDGSEILGRRGGLQSMESSTGEAALDLHGWRPEQLDGSPGRSARRKLNGGRLGDAELVPLAPFMAFR